MSPVAVGNALVAATAALAWVFVAVYGVFAPWRKSAAGWNLMGMGLAIAEITTLAVVRWVFGAGFDAAWFAWLRIVVFAQVPAVLLHRLWLLWRVLLADWRAARAARAADAADDRPG